MKKLLFLLVFAATTVACNTEKEEARTGTVTYNGTVTVRGNTDPSSVFVVEDTDFELVHEDGGYELTMHGIRFAERMPAVSITIPSLVLNNTGVCELTSSVDPIIPHIGELERDDFQILDFECLCPEYTLEVSFICLNPQMGADHTVEFTGTAIE